MEPGRRNRMPATSRPSHGTVCNLGSLTAEGETGETVHYGRRLALKANVKTVTVSMTMFGNSYFSMTDKNGPAHAQL
jgi:hypothetical protein